MLAISAQSETDAELCKEDIYDYTKGRKLDKDSYASRCKIAQNVYGEKLIRYCDSNDYRYQKGKNDTGDRSTLPDNMQNYGYTSEKRNGRGFSSGTEEGVSGTRKLNKKGFSFGDEEVDLRGLIEPEEAELSEAIERKISMLTQLQKDLLTCLRYVGIKEEERLGIMLALKEKEEQQQQMVDWIVENPTANSSEVIGQMMRLLK